MSFVSSHAIHHPHSYTYNTTHCKLETVITKTEVPQDSVETSLEVEMMEETMTLPQHLEIKREASLQELEMQVSLPLALLLSMDPQLELETLVESVVLLV